MMGKMKIINGLMLLTAFLLVSFSKVRNTGTDQRSTLLVSESIITRGSIKLDHYGPGVRERCDYTIHQKNDHFYDFFPLGTPLVGVPFVAVVRGWGFSMVQSEAYVQIMLASVTAVLTLFFLSKIAGLLLPAFSACLISGLFWFGTSLASTCGTALWSHNFATLFALIAIYSALKEAKGQGRCHWVPVGVCLFFAYLCRPNMALLAPALLLFFFSYNRRGAVKAGLLLAVLLACFAGFSLYEFNQILPDYYLPQRLGSYELDHFLSDRQIPATGFFLTALYGNLLGPARGLLIFSPFILFAWFCFGSSVKEFKLNKAWLLIGIVWPVLHLVVISNYPAWWAGWSFGARLMTDVLPGLFLLTLRTWPVAVRGKFGKISVFLLAISSVFAVYVHSYQGLFNPYSAQWNAEPNIDNNPEYLFDWKYPQFIHNRMRHTARLLEHGANILEPFCSGAMYEHASDRVIFLDWCGAEKTHRWSFGTSSAILFMLNSEALPEFTGELLLSAGTLGRQRLTIYLNDAEIYCGQHASWSVELKIPFSPALLNAGCNTLRFETPDARAPGSGDPRILALAFKSFLIQ